MRSFVAVSLVLLMTAVTVAATLSPNPAALDGEGSGTTDPSVIPCPGPAPASDSHPEVVPLPAARLRLARSVEGTVDGALGGAPEGWQGSVAILGAPCHGDESAKCVAAGRLSSGLTIACVAARRHESGVGSLGPVTTCLPGPAVPSAAVGTAAFDYTDVVTRFTGTLTLNLTGEAVTEAVNLCV